MRIRNIYVKILLLFAAGIFCFFAIGGMLLHNHEDPIQHDDCQICQWALICVFVFSIVLILLCPLFFYHKAIAHIEAFVSIFCKTNLHLRSPPAVLPVS